MVKDKLYSYASKRATAMSKRPLPGYWRALQLVALSGFGVFVAVQLLGGGGGPITAAVPSLESQQPGTSSESTQATADPTVAPSSEPVPVTPPVSGSATVEVVDSTGGPVAVPAAAAALASDGLLAMFDPEAAARVPAFGGGTAPAPARDFPDASVGALVFVTSSEDGARLVFAAATDADGTGTTFAPVHATVTTVLDSSGAWTVELR